MVRSSPLRQNGRGMSPDSHPPVPDARPGVSTRPALRELRLADDPRAWARLGFTVRDGACRIGEVVLRFEDPRPGDHGIVGWTLAAATVGADLSIDGLPTEVAPAGPTAGDPPPDGHANGAVLVDHVVVTTPDLQRTFAALERAGLELRRIREAGPAPPAMQQAGLPEAQLRQGFYRLGAPVLEVVGPDRPRSAGRRSGGLLGACRRGTRSRGLRPAGRRAPGCAA